MKKILLNAHLYILLLAPIFLVVVCCFFHPAENLKLTEVQFDVFGCFNRKTIFQMGCNAFENTLFSSLFGK